MAGVVIGYCPYSSPSSRPDVRLLFWLLTVSTLSSIVTLVCSATLVSAASSSPLIESIRAVSSNDATRVILTFSAPVPYRIAADPHQGSPSRLHLRFSPVRLAPGLRSSFEVQDRLLKAVRVGQLAPSTIRVTLDVKDVGKYQTKTLRSPHQVVVLLKKNVEKSSLSSQASPSQQRSPQARTKRPLQAAPTPTPVRRKAAVQKQPSTPPISRPQKPEEKAVTPPLPLPRSDKQLTRSPASSPLLPSSPALEPSPTVKQKRQKATPSLSSPSANSEKLPTPSSTPSRSLPLANSEKLSDLSSTLPTPSRSSTYTEQHAALTVPTPPAPPLPDEQESQPSAPQRYRIVLDPGHGGTDPGARGIGGLEEKTVVLAVAKRLAQKLRSRLGVEVILTRTRDVFIPLPERTARANAAKADLFISIHANASLNPESRGIETYYLNNTNDRATIRLAKLENGIREKQQLPQREAELSYILSDLIQTGKEEESIALAEFLQTALVQQVSRKYPEVRDIGVKQGPFYVLVGAHMPCVLVELSFLTHPVEGKNLGSRTYQEALAEGLFAGIARFFRTGLAERNL